MPQLSPCDVCGLEEAQVHHQGERLCLDCAPPCPACAACGIPREDAWGHPDGDHDFVACAEPTRWQLGGNDRVSLECPAHGGWQS